MRKPRNEVSHDTNEQLPFHGAKDVPNNGREEDQKELKNKNFVCGMSRKGNCWDNALMKSFWGKLKTEWLYGKRFRTRGEAKQAVFEYIELFYNRKRRRSVNGYIPPLKMGIAA